MVQEDKERCEMNKKMMVMPFLFLILMAIPMVDASEGNETVADVPDDVLVILNITEPDLASIQLQLDNIYAWMIGHDTVMMGTRNMVREINGTLNDRITNLTNSTVTIIDFEAEIWDIWSKVRDEHKAIWTVNMEMKSQLDVQNTEIDFQRTLIDELRHEVWLLNRELEAERAMRNNITIMFGLFSVIVIVITYVMSKK